MRLAAIIALAGACYRPSAPTGAPCDPTAPRCPGGQTCEIVAGDFACTTGAGDVHDAPLVADAPPDVPGHDGPPTDARPVDGAPDAMPDAMPDAQLPLHADYGAGVAECIDPNVPDPDLCQSLSGADTMVVDGDATEHNDDPWYVFIRFDLDAQLAGRTPTAVRLVLTATNAMDAGGPESGEVWQVTAFTRASLGGTTPAKIGTLPLAPSQGAVALGQTVTWSLPITSVAANTPLYLGLFPKSTSGVNYWNKAGTTPPRLHVDAP